MNVGRRLQDVRRKTKTRVEGIMPQKVGTIVRPAETRFRKGGQVMGQTIGDRMKRTTQRARRKIEDIRPHALPRVREEMQRFSPFDRGTGPAGVREPRHEERGEAPRREDSPAGVGEGRYE